MTWDLWGPPVEPECGDDVPVQPPLQCDLRAGFGVDVIEEDVLNDKSCVQVLRILVAKADAEIEELEEYLVSLQCELAWEEQYEEFYDICCDALKERINSLEASLSNLRSNARDSASDTLTIEREPVEGTQEIFKALLRNYHPKVHDKTVETRLGTYSLNTQLTSASDCNRQQEPSETAIEELFQQLTDLVAECNTPNNLKKNFEAKSGAFEDSVMQPATSNMILESRDEMGDPKSAESDETRGLSLEREAKREDRKFSLASIAHLQDRGSKSMSDSQSCKEEDQPAEFVQLNDESKWALQLFEERPKMKRKMELDGPGAERSLFPRKENCSLNSKSKVAGKFGIKNSSFNKPIMEKTGKKMILALSALPPEEKGEMLQQISEGKTNASVNVSSPVSQKKGADDIILKEGSPLTGSEKLHKHLVKFPVDAEEVNLEELKVKDLRAIAKQNKLRKYYKLPKKELVEKIASSLEPH